MTCLTGTLLQHMDTSEISRRKVAKIRLLLRHKLMQNHYQHAKELVAGTSPKSERTRQTLLNSLTVYQRNSMSTTPNGSGCSISYADIKHARGKVDNGHPVLQTSPPRVSLLDNSYVTVSSSADLESYQMLPRASMDNSRATPAVSSSADLESYQMHPRASIVSMDNRRATAVSSSADLESYQMHPRASIVSMDNRRATAVSSSADLESYQMHPRASIVSMDNRRATAVSSSADLESYQMQFFPED
jgi:hypothetical protein